MPGFPDKFMPFMKPDRWGNAAANFQRFTYGPAFRFFRKRNLRLKADDEPTWREHGPALETGYTPRW
jgi:hydrogenase small subunit